MFVNWWVMCNRVIFSQAHSKNVYHQINNYVPNKDIHNKSNILFGYCSHSIHCFPIHNSFSETNFWIGVIFWWLSPFFSFSLLARRLQPKSFSVTLLSAVCTSFCLPIFQLLGFLAIYRDLPGFKPGAHTHTHTHKYTEIHRIGRFVLFLGHPALTHNVIRHLILHCCFCFVVISPLFYLHISIK